MAGSSLTACTQDLIYLLALVWWWSQILTEFLSMMLSLVHHRTSTTWFWSLVGLTYALRGIWSLVGTFPPDLQRFCSLLNNGCLSLYFLSFPEEMLAVPFFFYSTGCYLRPLTPLYSNPSSIVYEWNNLIQVT